MRSPSPGTTGAATPLNVSADPSFLRIETREQLAAVVVTAGLVIGNFLMFTPWRDGQDPRHRDPTPSHPTPSPASFLLERSFTKPFVRASI